MEKKELDDELLRQSRALKRRKEQMKKRRQRQNLLKMAGCLVVLALIVGVTSFATSKLGLNGEKPAKKQQTESGSETVRETENKNAKILEEAELLAAGYDYDAAIEKIKSVKGYEQEESLTAAVTKYTTAKASCVAVDVDAVPHIYYHSLMNEPTVALDAAVMGQQEADNMNAWMTTVDEFDKITQAMYDNGYVFVRLRDLVVESKDENGNVIFTRNENLMLPPGKKPVVLSVDDLSYYHSYEKASYPDKLVLDKDGAVKCHYVKKDGTEEVGDFDVVPRLNSFLEEHPDGAYHGARGMIALTGYDGVFGYRTDTAYQTKENLTADQSAWLEAHPDFDWDNEVKEATKIAEAIKKSGWEFANHTWGHLNVSNKTVDELKADNDKWVNTVQNIVGETDTFIFTHGGDIGDWHDYSADNAKFNFYKEAGYNFFCNVDGSVPYWVQIRENYVRQGRINLDGYMLYRASQGQTEVLNDLFDAKQVFNESRPTPVAANGGS